MTDSADFAVADDDEMDSWLSTPGLREALIEAEADFAAGRTIGSQEVQARFGLPLRHVE
jgi:PHD/YefM family antitoxin component YafN of YafNO toxin-antitoxin module